MAKILIVDDDPMSIEFLKIFLESEGHTTDTALSSSEAVDKIKASIPEVLLTDLNLGDSSGEEIINYLIKNDHQIKIIIMSGYGKSHINNKDLKYDFLITKPVDLNKLNELLI